MPGGVADRRRRALILLILLGLTLTGLTAGAGSAAAQKISGDFWAMHDKDWVTPPTVPVGAANFTTAGTYWPAIQLSKRRFDWSRLDTQVDAAHAIGAQPMLVLGKSPRFASTRPKSDDYQDHPPKLKPWKKYVSKVANRYGTRIDYQIWPEPNIIQNWHGTPAQMAKLTMVASKAIRQARRQEGQGRLAGGRAAAEEPAQVDREVLQAEGRRQAGPHLRGRHRDRPLP